MKSILETIAVPTPPYRMPRPVHAVLAVAETPVPPVEVASEKPKTLEVGDITKKGESLRQDVMNAKLPEGATPEQQAALRQLQSEYASRVSALMGEVERMNPPKSVPAASVPAPSPKKTPPRNAEPKEARKKLNTLEEERESLLRARGTMSEKEFAQRLQEYDLAMLSRDGGTVEKPVAKEAPEVGSKKIYVRPGKPLEPTKPHSSDVAPQSEDTQPPQDVVPAPTFEFNRKPAPWIKPEQVAELKEAYEKTKQEEEEKKAAAEKAAAELKPEEPSAEPPTEKTVAVEVGPKAEKEGFMSRFWEWMEEKPAIEIWLDGQRARVFAAINGYFQGRAEGKLQLAEDRLKEYERKLAGAGPFKKMWYGERIVEWQERVAELTAKAEAWNIWRETHVERHRTFARGVIDRYEQELAPYRGLAHDFSSRMDVQQNIRATLAQKRDEAMKLLVETESAGRKGRWTVRPDARREVDRIRKQIEEINRRIRQAERAVEMNRTELGRVHAKIREGELKRDAVAASMKFPEFDALRTYARPKETVPAPASEKIELRKWDTAKFIEAWNGLGLVRIEDEQGFITHVEREREVSGASGLPTTEELLDLVSSYIEGAGISKAQKQQLKRDKQFFLDNA